MRLRCRAGFVGKKSKMKRYVYRRPFDYARANRLGRVLLIVESAEVGTLTTWAVTGTKRFLRSQVAGSGTTITMKQALNETRSFQILTHAADHLVTNFNITTSALTTTDGDILAASNIIVNRAKQIEVVQTTFRNANDTSVGVIGWYPDALIPAVHPVTGVAIPAGSTYQALPFTVQQDQTHTFLLDIRVPKTTTAGVYTGVVTVTADNQDDVEVDITLTVWDWVLPDRSAFKTDFGTPDVRMYSNRQGGGTELLPFVPSDWDDVTNICNTIFAKNGLSAQSKDILNPRFRMDDIGDDLWAYPTDEVLPLQIHIDTYHPSVFRVTSGLILSTYDINPFDADDLTAYMTATEEGLAVVDRPGTQFYVWLYDEGWRDPDFVNEWGNPILYDSTVDCLVGTPVTTDVHGGDSMVDAINTWAVEMKTYDVDEAAAQATRKALGEEFWMYTGLSGVPFSGTRPHWHLDRDILNYRVLPWICWHEDLTGSLYSGASIGVWMTLASGRDPWTEPVTVMRGERIGETVAVEQGSPTITFSSLTGAGDIDKYFSIQASSGDEAIYRVTSIVGTTGTLSSNYLGDTDPSADYYYEPFNSDFLLVYPCSEADVGYDGCVETMRLKALRDGIQDYGYFALCAEYSVEDDADDEVNALITAIGDGDWEWESDDPDLYDAARERLGVILEYRMTTLIAANKGHWFRQPSNKPHFMQLENRPHFIQENNKPHFAVT